MPLLLFLQPLAQRLHQLFPAAERRDFLFLFVGQRAFRESPQPVRRDLGDDAIEQRLRALEGFREHPIETIVVRLVLHERRPREVVELLGRAGRDMPLQPFEQRQEFR